MSKSKDMESIESRTKATWEKNVIHIFCDLCLKEIEVGNRPGTHFNKNGWNNIVNNFKKETNRYYDRHQLKNKWDQLKKEWKQWKQLLKNETGIGWDPWRRTVDAADEWWRDKLKVYISHIIHNICIFYYSSYLTIK